MGCKPPVSISGSDAVVLQDLFSPLLTVYWRKSINHEVIKPIPSQVLLATEITLLTWLRMPLASFCTRVMHIKKTLNHSKREISSLPMNNSIRHHSTCNKDSSFACPPPHSGIVCNCTQNRQRKKLRPTHKPHLYIHASSLKKEKIRQRLISFLPLWSLEDIINWK